MTKEMSITFGRYLKMAVRNLPRVGKNLNSLDTNDVANCYHPYDILHNQSIKQVVKSNYKDRKNP